MNNTLEIQTDEKANKLEIALNRKSARFTVKLSNCGNPDYRQDSRRPLPETTCGWAHVETLKEAAEICGTYISFYDLGGGNWNGGEIVRNDGLVIGYVSYNGRIWEGTKRNWSSKTKEIIP